MSDSADDFGPDEVGDVRYQDEVEPGKLSEALTNLKLLGDDPFLRMQAFNLDVVDSFLMDLEHDVLRKLNEEDRTPGEAHFLNAQSQMWIFATYELLRTWIERAKDIIRWASNGGLHQKLDALRGQHGGFMHFGRDIRIAQIEAVVADPGMMNVLQDQLKHIHIPFARMEYIRVSLAKHQISGKAKSIAPNPGYGRINAWCGSLDYALENGHVHLGLISRRDIADSLRALRLDEAPPSDEDLQAFDTYMKA